MKKTIILLSCLLITNIQAQQEQIQEKEISRSWTSFVQSINVSTDKEVKFRLTASVKRISDHESAVAGLWVRIDNKNNEVGFFDNMMDRPVIEKRWKTYTIEGSFNKNAKTLNFGGICMMNGDFYFDNFKLFIQNDNKIFEAVEIQNGDFEQHGVENQIPGWQQGVRIGTVVKIKEFSSTLSIDPSGKDHSLLISGRNIKENDRYILKPKEGYTTQIGTLVSMLNALKTRVEYAVRDLNQYELDYLMDEKANRIGALIYHLAAAEKYYQVYTFENRSFNEEEKNKWEAALKLGEEGRNLLQGHDVAYYLDLYNEVRKKTLEEFKKKDDSWLEEQKPGSAVNNFYSWFHVMEHQSSHLGQILLLKKRIPPKKEPEKIIQKENIKG